MSIEESGHGVEYNTNDDFYNFILNDLFLPAVADTVITPNTLLERLPRDKERVEGKDVIFPIHTGRNLGVNAIAAGGDLPDPGQQAYDRYNFPVRHIYGRIKFDGITEDASRTQMASWLKVVEAEVMGLARDLSRYRQRTYWLDGTGILADTEAAGTSSITTIDLTTPSNIQSSAAALSPSWAPTKYLRTGMRVGFVRSSQDEGDLEAVRTITVTDDNTITWTGAWTPEENEVYYVTLVSNDDDADDIANNTNDNMAFINDPMGLSGIMDDTNPYEGGATPLFQGIDADANTFHQAHIINGAAATDQTLTNDLMDEAFTTPMELADATPTIVIGSYGIIRAYAAILINERQFVGTTEYDGGYSGLTYDGVPVIADRDCPNNRLFFIHEPDLRIYVMAEPSWMQKDGSIYHRIPNKDAYQATMYCRETMGSDVRDRQTLLVSVTESPNP